MPNRHVLPKKKEQKKKLFISSVSGLLAWKKNEAETWDGVSLLTDVRAAFWAATELCHGPAWLACWSVTPSSRGPWDSGRRLSRSSGQVQVHLQLPFV